MSLDSEDLTPSIDRYQPQHIVGRRHVQLRSPSEHLQQTGNGNAPRDDDVIIKTASQLTVDVINSAVRVYAAEQSVSGDDTGNDREPAEASSTTQTSLPTSGPTGNESASRSTDVDTEATTSVDGREAEALQDIARLQALTRQLRAAVAESRSADGLPVDVDDTGTTRTSTKDLEQAGQREDNDDMVSVACIHWVTLSFPNTNILHRIFTPNLISSC